MHTAAAFMSGGWIALGAPFFISRLGLRGPENKKPVLAGLVRNGRWTARGLMQLLSAAADGYF